MTVFVVFFTGKKSTASAHLPAPTMFTTKLSFNCEDFQRTRSFLLLKALINEDRSNKCKENFAAFVRSVKLAN